VEFYFGPSSVRKSGCTLVRQQRGLHFEHVRVMQEPVEQRGNGGGIAEQLAPIIDGQV
jgi:hypothetical protein